MPSSFAPQRTASLRACNSDITLCFLRPTKLATGMFNIDIDHHARDVFVFLSEVRAISLGTKQLAHVDVLATQTVKRGMGDNLKELRTLMAMS